ncbi:MAG: zinc-ribbon domain-containing protein [Cypionkella sp.]
MRLVCPNCDAEYEVDDTAIPLAGRDVQCSNCGHAWFQAHTSVLAEQADEEALFGAPQVPIAPEPEAVLEAEAVAVQAAATDVEAATPAAPEANATPDTAFEAEPTSDTNLAEPYVSAGAEAGAPATRNIDESVLAVLREEAAREAAARRSETPPALETQTEMPLEPEAERRVSRTKVTPAMEQPAPAAEAVRSRGDRLPAIEEINSTLRATSDRAGDSAEDALPNLLAQRHSRSGFSQGFLLLVLLGVVILALYVFAPLIAAKVPALAGEASAYVAAVDTVRHWLDTEIKALIGVLRGFAGTQDG